MPFHFESTSDFFKSMLSIETLVEFAKVEEGFNRGENRVLFLKLAIVSMVTQSFRYLLRKFWKNFCSVLRLVK
jgi:hypothetical protein